MELKSIKQMLSDGEPLTIVVPGDSLTQGWMVRKGYVDFLEDFLKKKYPASSFNLINRGHPGDTAEGGLYRLKIDVLDMDPDLVLIQFALNDAYMGITAQRFKESIAFMIGRIRDETSAEILLLSSVPIMMEHDNRMAEEFYDVLVSVSENDNVPIALVHRYWNKKVSEGLDFNQLVQNDRVHPNVEGHRIMAEAVMELF